jgi:4-amino-4-deoxy-L-arabinose transferase-like glycosyltransferase
MLKAKTNRQSTTQGWKRWTSPSKLLLLILLISVALRIGGAFYLGDEMRALPGTNDQISYHTLAQLLLDGHGFSFGEGWWPVTQAGAPTAHWSFLYTFYVAGVYAIFGVQPLAARLIQVVIVGLLHPYLTYLIAQRLFATDAAQSGTRAKLARIAPLIAAGITAVYAYFVYYAAALMTEPFYITAILGAIYLAVRITDRVTAEDGSTPAPTPWKLALALGLVLAAGVLLRQLFMLFVPFLGFWMLWRGWQTGRLRPIILSLTAAAVIVILAIAPFTAYNYARFDRLVLLNTNAGYAFYFGNHPIYGTRFVGILPEHMGKYSDLIPVELRHLDEAALDQALLKEALDIIVTDPGRYLLLSLSRAEEYFKFWPSPNSSPISNFSRVASFGLMLPFMLYGLWRVFAAYRSSPVLWLLFLFMSFYTAIHMLTWTLIRYRLPVDAVLILFAGYGIADLVQRLSYRRSSRDLAQHWRVGDPTA